MGTRRNPDYAGIAWLLQRVTGAGLVVLLAFHFGVEHFLVGAANVTAENTLVRLSEGKIVADHIFEVTITLPALLYQAITLLLLSFAVYHGMYGVYNILAEQGFSDRTMVILRYAFVALSIALIVQGMLIFAAFTGGGA